MGFYCNLCRFVAKSVIHAVLLRNFCHNLRSFMWRKIEPKSLFVEKKWQISGLYGAIYKVGRKVHTAHCIISAKMFCIFANWNSFVQKSFFICTETILDAVLISKFLSAPLQRGADCIIWTKMFCIYAKLFFHLYNDHVCLCTETILVFVPRRGREGGADCTISANFPQPWAPEYQYGNQICISDVVFWVHFSWRSCKGSMYLMFASFLSEAFNVAACTPSGFEASAL